MNVIVSEEMQMMCPGFVGACLEAEVENSVYCEDLWNEISAHCDKWKTKLTPELIKAIPSIDATRNVYKKCGKDPSRYRPASEALLRRVVTGKDLYKGDTLVDLINLASMMYGNSIGGFDADKFVGETLTLGIGEADEPYEGIGRGMINIEHLPGYRR